MNVQIPIIFVRKWVNPKSYNYSRCRETHYNRVKVESIKNTRAYSEADANDLLTPKIKTLYNYIQDLREEYYEKNLYIKSLRIEPIINDVEPIERVNRFWLYLELDILTLNFEFVSSKSDIHSSLEFYIQVMTFYTAVEIQKILYLKYYKKLNTPVFFFTENRSLIKFKNNNITYALYRYCVRHDRYDNYPATKTTKIFLKIENKLYIKDDYFYSDPFLLQNSNLQKLTVAEAEKLIVKHFCQ